jgi:hypothetical protein
MPGSLLPNVEECDKFARIVPPVQPVFCDQCMELGRSPATVGGFVLVSLCYVSLRWLVIAGRRVVRRRIASSWTPQC